MRIRNRVTISEQQLTLRILSVSGDKRDINNGVTSRCQTESLDFVVLDDLASQFSLGDVVEVFALVHHLPSTTGKIPASRFGHPIQLRVLFIQMIDRSHFL